MAFGDARGAAGPQLQHPPGRDLRDHGRQRLRQEHADAAHDRAQPRPPRATCSTTASRSGRRTRSARERLKRRFGVLYQNAALFSSMTLEENVSLPLVEHARPGAADDARAVARLKLALVGLAGFEDHYPAEISGGMRKRAGLARAMALDPEILYFDEPSAGLDPLSSRRLDDLILELRDSLGHHDRARHPRAAQHLRAGRQCRVPRCGAQDHDCPGAGRRSSRTSPDPKVRAFLSRGRL